MKKSMLYILTTAITFIILSGCGCKFIKINSPCMITEYMKISTIITQTVDTDNRIFKVEYKYSGNINFGPKSTDAEKEKFLKDYSAKYGDLSYNMPIMYMEHCNITFERPHKSALPDMAKISVTSNKDFDADHPAGTDLGDMIWFSGASLYPYIHNGYKPTYDNINEFETKNGTADNIVLNSISNVNESNSSIRNSSTPIFKYLNELTSEDLYLSGIDGDSYFYITLTKEAENKEMHVFTLTMTGDDGSVFTTQFFYDFRQEK